MLPIFESTFIQVIVGLIVIAISVKLYYKHSYNYWKNRNCPTVPVKFPFGVVENPLNTKQYVGVRCKEEYLKTRSLGYRHVGVYLVTVPIYIPLDPVLIKCVLQQDFQYFTDRGFYYNEKDDPLSANLFALGGDKWRYIRTKLSPVFTSGKLKMMFEILVKCGNQLSEAIDNIYENKREIDVKDVSACFSTDVIGSCAFGLDCNSFKDPNSVFRYYGKGIFDFTSGFRRAKIVFAFAFYNLARTLGVTLFGQDCINFFMNLVRDTIKFRQENKVVRNDLMQLLMGLVENKTLYYEKTIRELAAQAFIFFAAGFETSSTTLTFCLYELSKNPDVQQKLRQEINLTLEKHQGKITYDSISSMKYLDQVIDETLRKYPPLSFITRVCMKDYEVPGTKVTVEKGTSVLVSILGLHHDPEYYPEPEKFDPERFSDANKKERIPFTYLPFGEGPRICIGLRFGLMQIKVALIVLLRKHRFSVNNKTKEPIEFDPHSFTMAAKDGIFLDIEKT